MRSDDDQRGARYRARFNRATTLYPAGPKTRTMMQSCASAAKLRSGGPIFPVGVKAKGHVGIPPPRTVIGAPSQACGQGRFSALQSLGRTQNNTVWYNALPHEPPQGDQKLTRQGHDHGLSSTASVLGAGSNHCVKALFFWCRRNRHSQHTENNGGSDHLGLVRSLGAIYSAARDSFVAAGNVKEDARTS
jgi:hypothetical protein